MKGVRLKRLWFWSSVLSLPGLDKVPKVSGTYTAVKEGMLSQVFAVK